MGPLPLVRRAEGGGMKAKTKPHYSGDKSKAFWKRVDSVKNAKKRSEMYVLGCILQSLEGYVLDALSDAEKSKGRTA